MTCPCLWKEVDAEVRPVAIPKYNNENRWYIEKYQSILGVFEQDAALASGDGRSKIKIAGRYGEGAAGIPY